MIDENSGESARMTTVLTFHRVVDRLEQDHDLSWDSFRRLADSLSGSMTDLESPSSSQAIAMTFDDGTEDHIRAAEELRRRGLSAIFFIPAGHIGDPGRLDAAQVQELVSMGHVVGSHALHHRPLARHPASAAAARGARVAHPIGGDLREAHRLLRATRWDRSPGSDRRPEIRGVSRLSIHALGDLWR